MSSTRVYVGIDLGSTTTKAVILDENGRVAGRGITNSRSNYDVACAVVRDEAFVRVRFSMTEERLRSDPAIAAIPSLERYFRLHQHLDQLARLRRSMHAAAETPRHRSYAAELSRIIDTIADQMAERATSTHFAPGATRRSDFFRDLASVDYMDLAMEMSDPKGIRFEVLCSMFDAAILVVENSIDEVSFQRHISSALASANAPPSLRSVVEDVCAVEIIEAGTVGTGYGRQRLPFPKEQIRSEILCHGLGAHARFPGTR
ncbi:MAG: BadF/BadG/BcrA/BcrD ATPase family protein, partial [Acidobacteriota bacterium]